MTQAEAGGFAVKDRSESSTEAARRRDEDAENILESQCVQSPSVRAVKRVKHESTGIQPITVSNWMFDVVSDLTRSGAAAPPNAAVAERDTTHLGRFVPMESFTGDCPPVPGSGKGKSMARVEGRRSRVHTTASCRLSLQLSPTPPAYSLSNSSTIVGDDDSEDEKRPQPAWSRRVDNFTLTPQSSMSGSAGTPSKSSRTRVLRRSQSSSSLPKLTRHRWGVGVSA